MKIRYLYSACVVISTEDCTVLCDPWFYPAYDGAWAQWPKIEKPLEVCGPANLVYISHVHPDHYDPQFLSEYLARYPQAKVLIAKQEPALLERKLRSRGIKPVVGMQRIGETWLDPIANRANRGLNIDSALVVRRGALSVANLNDNPYDQVQVDSIRVACQFNPTVALLPFVGAGPWPQCYAFDAPDDQLKAAEAKKQKYLGVFRRYCEALQPAVAVPFAGQYWLHGPQLDLNPLRGMADATEVVPIANELEQVVWIPADGGQSTYDLETRTANSCRRNPYDWSTVRQWLIAGHPRSIYMEGVHEPYRYEREIQVPVERLPLLKLLESAVANAWLEFEHRPKLHVCIKTQLPQWFVLRTTELPVEERQTVDDLEPRYEVRLDARYLFGGLTRLYNMNNIRIGSLARFKVVPAEPFDEQLYDLFGDFWDSLRV